MTTVLKPDANEILKEEIDKRGLKRKFVADKIGVSSNYFSQVLNGTRSLSTDIAVKASQTLQIPLEIFLQNSSLK